MTGGADFENEFPVGQSNLDCIEPNLWLGNLNAAKDVHLINEKKINFILTVNSFPLPGKIYQLENVKIKYIEVSDSPRDDLLSHFEETYQFIEDGLRNGVVLVHCFCGVSRSATVVAAYIMKMQNVKVEAALEYVKSKRKSIGPNPGFLSQLHLYETMNYTVDKSNVQYKMFKLFIVKELVKNEKTLPKHCSDIIKSDPSLVKIKYNEGVYKCRKCRRVLAQNSNIIPHASGEKYSWRDRRWSDNLEMSDICQKTYFVEPLAWMEDVSGSPEGKLHCPNERCRCKLGAFSWVTGCLCPCGTTVSPGFYLIPSKVDKVVQNL